MMENFPNMNQWLEIRDKALEKGLETGCRIAVKLTEKAVEFLDMAETYLPGIKEKLEPLIGNLSTSDDETPCCCKSTPVAPAAVATPAPVPAPKPEKAKPERSASARSESSQLKDQLESLPDELLTQVFSRNQFLKVLYLMVLSERKWLSPQEVSEMGDLTGFHILPQNVRKVIQQKGMDSGMIKVRDRAESRKGAKEYHITSKGEALLKLEFHLE
jgi:hypothetical protein